jgi:hypothetical protein
MKNVIINNGKATVTVVAAHNVTVTEKEIVITLNKLNTLTHPKSPTKRKKTTIKSKTKKTTTVKRGRPRKAKA